MDTFVVIVAVALILGVNTIIWSLVGIGRAAFERAGRPGRSRVAGEPVHSSAADANAADAYERPTLDGVAVVIAAHNEQAVIVDTIRSVKRQLPARQIFVASDGSHDATTAMCVAEGVNVVELFPNRGKAAAIVACIEAFDIVDRFDVVTLLDADTLLTPDYFETGLEQFDGPDVVAVAGRAQTRDDHPPSTLGGRILVAYRQRLYLAVQYLQKYGQAARRANAVSIVPGFASMYRTEAIRDVDIAAPGLAIEDFNMTFEVHAKSLGRIAFHPHKAIAVTQDPDTLRDYTKQIRRWTLGFWQTVRRHRFRWRLFWLALSLFIVEVIVSSVLLLIASALLLVSLGAAVGLAFGADPGGAAGDIVQTFPPLALLFVIVVPDLLLTGFATVVSRSPRPLLYALVFPLVRIMDAYLCMLSLVDASGARSSGTWQSPQRRRATVVQDSGAQLTNV